MHTQNHISLVVGITYSTMDLTVDESSGSVTVCLTKNITTDGIVEVLLKAEEKPDIPNKADGRLN